MLRRVLCVDVAAVQALGARATAAAATLRLLAGAANAALGDLAEAAEVDAALAAQATRASAEERAQLGRLAEWATSLGDRLPAAAIEYARRDAASAADPCRLRT